MQLPTQFSACRYALTCILRGSEIPLFIFKTIYRIAHFGLTTTVVHLPNSPLMKICRGFTRRKKCLKPWALRLGLHSSLHRPPVRKLGWHATDQVRLIWVQQESLRPPHSLHYRLRSLLHTLPQLRRSRWRACSAHVYNCESSGAYECKDRRPIPEAAVARRDPFYLPYVIFLTLPPIHYLSYHTVFTSSHNLALPCRPSSFLTLIAYFPDCRRYFNITL